MATPIKEWSKLERCHQDNGDEDTTHIGVGPGGDFQINNNLFDNLIIGDETWVHLNTPETKRDSLTWKYPSSLVTKKFKVQRSTAKVMATVFWDAKDVILLDILPQEQQNITAILLRAITSEDEIYILSHLLLSLIYRDSLSLSLSRNRGNAFTFT
ncbi:transposase [Plakobranchus ocellatus]|uniref:Transposase n=1 Tax=Plakobranchus ocellatus TaxID=259542 RepID=A0AAV4ASS6_9GAST|nr:transposase [Plakobranchus ocellatus]